ncbi:SPOSA6832_02988, partial [Sporobolomyces salmonicolor]
MSLTRFPYGASSSSTSGSIALEQANADLTLLQQSLARSSKISDRMSNVLGELDDRLAKLEKSLVPIYKETGKLTRVSKNLESTMRSIDGLLGHHDLVEREEGLIKAAPKPDDLKPYLAAIDRLVSASEALRKTDAKGQGATLAQMAALIESGGKQLVGVFRQWVKETSPSLDAGSLFDKGKPFPTLSPSFLEHGLPLLSYLIALPDPIGPKLFAEATRSYTDLRAAWIEEGMRNAAKEVLTDATPQLAGASSAGSAGVRGEIAAGVERKGLGRFLDVLFAILKVHFPLLSPECSDDLDTDDFPRRQQSEHALLGTVFATLSPSQRSPLYASLLPPSLSLFLSTGQSLNTLIRKSLHSLIPIAFACYTELQDRSGEFEEWARAKAARKENELGELTHAFRGTCLTSLPGILEDTKVCFAGDQGVSGRAWLTISFDLTAIWDEGADGSGGNLGRCQLDHHRRVFPFPLLQIRHWNPDIPSRLDAQVVNFMRQLADNQPTVETFLTVLGPGNWGGPKSSSTGKDDGDDLLPRYLTDLVSTLLSSLDTRSRGLRGPKGTSAIFLLNNISFLRHSILSSLVSDLLGESFEDSLNKRMRSVKSSYLEIWSPLVSALLDAGLAEQSGATSAIKAGIGAVKGTGGTERRETKDRFVRFHEALEEVEALHHAARLEEGEVEMRERLKGEVERMVVPTYAKFVQRHRKDNYSAKYVRLDAEGLEAKIRSIFE